jgi:cell division septal protein FtsQ
LLPSARSLLVAAALVGAAAVLYAGARATSVFAVETIEVRGASAATAAEVRGALATVEGTSLLALDGSEVVARARKIPAVASAEYDRAFPHTLVVFVREEQPAAIVRRGADAWVVAASGRVLRTARRGARSPLPRVWVPARTRVVAGDTLADPVAAGAVAAVAHVGAGFPAEVRDVRSSAEELTFRLGSGFELRLGNGRDLDLKLAIAARILPTLTAAETAEASYLDVSVVERPVAGGTLNAMVEVEG